MLEQWNASANVCPKIRKKRLKNAEYANTCYAVPAGKGIFQVQSGDFQYNVDIVGRHCDCRRWDLTGLPCSHAISCLRHERIPTESVVPHCYSVQAFAEAYGFSIWPCADKSEWFKVVGCPEVLPQSMRRRLAGQKNQGESNHMRLQENKGPGCQSMGWRCIVHTARKLDTTLQVAH